MPVNSDKMSSMKMIKQIVVSFALAASLLGLSACSTNPATGKSSFTAFMSAEEEMRVGAEEHPKIIAQFGGAYNDPELGFYVARVGAKLASYSEMPDLTFTFTVLNDEKVNAFALPGGYVYITRGLLAIATDEAEMAGVLAHEIGHVTARHTAQRYSATKATNIGLQVLGVLGSVAGLPTGAGTLMSYGAQAALQSYSREHELEADQLGVRYLSRAGYDPDAMTGFFYKLQAHTKLRADMAGQEDKSEDFNIMSTHPLTSERISEAKRRAAQANVTGRERGKAAFVERIDGMIFGQDQSQGIIRGRLFEHADLGIRFEVPPDFDIINMPTQVIARDGQGAAVIFDMANASVVKQNGGIANYLAALDVNGGKFQNIESLSVNGMSSVIGTIKLGEEDLRMLVIEGNKDRIFRLQFRTKPARTKQMEDAFKRMTFSFRRMGENEIAASKPLRIRFQTVKRGDTPTSIASFMQMGKFNQQWFELLNGIKPGDYLTPGSQVRVIIE